jgi:hypothetical protein
MTSRFSRSRIGLAVILLAAVPTAPVSAQAVKSSTAPTAVRGASIQVVRRAVDLAWVAIHNRRDAPLVEWQITFYRDATFRSASATSHYWRTETPASATDGPIGPGEVRRQRATGSAAAPGAAARATLAVFADGTYDGEPKSVAEFLTRQRALAADLIYWRDLFAAMPPDDEAAAKAHLRKSTLERRIQAADDPSKLRGQVEQWVDGDRLPNWVYTMANSRREEMAMSLARAERYLAQRGSLGTWNGSQPAAEVAIQPGVGADLVLIIQNLRDVPLEAWRCTVTKPGARTPDQGRGFDANGPSHGLGPRAVTESYLGAADDMADANLPTANLTLAVWNDLSFEGSPSERDDLFRDRESEAAAYDYWIPALTDASTRTGRDAMVLLRQKRDERIRQAPREPDFFQSHLGNYADHADRSPTEPATWLVGYGDRLVQRREWLLRHLAGR